MAARLPGGREERLRGRATTDPAAAVQQAHECRERIHDAAVAGASDKAAWLQERHLLELPAVVPGPGARRGSGALGVPLRR